MTTKKIATKKKVTKEATLEDMVLGNEIKEEIKTIVTYEDNSIIYKITNLIVGNNPIEVRGDVIESFIGSNNKIARKELAEGAKKVITKDKNGKEEFLIEVMG